MLPKPEKTRKSAAHPPRQLDLVETIDTADKIKKKRRLLIIALISTIGLSLCFWLYRGISQMIATRSYPQLTFSAPQINVPLNTPASLDSKVASVIKNSPSSWSIYASEITGTFSWSRQSDLSSNALNEIYENLNHQLPSANSFISSALPSGVEVRQTLLDNGSSRDYYFLLTIPKKQIILAFRLSGTDLDASAALIPEISSQIYWHILRTDTN